VHRYQLRHASNIHKIRRWLPTERAPAESSRCCNSNTRCSIDPHNRWRERAFGLSRSGFRKPAVEFEIFGVRVKASTASSRPRLRARDMFAAARVYAPRRVGHWPAPPSAYRSRSRWEPRSRRGTADTPIRSAKWAINAGARSDPSSGNRAYCL
jgi:ribosomal protein S14